MNSDYYAYILALINKEAVQEKFEMERLWLHAPEPVEPSNEEVVDTEEDEHKQRGFTIVDFTI
tara:strand:+ start:982 stop:1170 length:189 start_codon:yes stop_codon:yes gene_type:complete